MLAAANNTFAAVLCGDLNLRSRQLQQKQHALSAPTQRSLRLCREYILRMSSKSQAQAVEAAVKAQEMVQESKGSVGEVGGVAAVAGVAGLVLVGPVVAVVGAVGAGYVAATQENGAGEVARATGRAATTAVERAREYDREHHVTEKVKEAAASAVETAKDIDQRFHVTENVKQGAATAWGRAKEFEAKHELGRKMSTGLVSGLNGLNRAMGGGQSGGQHK